MPSVSQSQQRAMAMAAAAKKGKIPPSKLRGAAREMYQNMSEKTLDEFARTPRKGLPKHVKKKVKGK